MLFNVSTWGGTAPGGPRILTPADLSGATLWYDPSDAATVLVDGSNNVSQLNDKIGTRHATQGTASIQPKYDPVKKTVGTPSAEGKLSIPAVAVSRYWSLAVFRFSTAHLASSDGTIVALNGTAGSAGQRTPSVQYALGGGLVIQWRDTSGGYNDVTFAPGVDFVAGAFLSVLQYIRGGVHYVSVNGGVAKSAGSAITPAAVGAAGFIGDFRTGWTEFALRTYATGTDQLTDAQLAGLAAYAASLVATGNS